MFDLFPGTAVHLADPLDQAMPRHRSDGPTDSNTAFVNARLGCDDRAEMSS